jgi:hypothetical protein
MNIEYVCYCGLEEGHNLLREFPYFSSTFLEPFICRIPVLRSLLFLIMTPKDSRLFFCPLLAICVYFFTPEFCWLRTFGEEGTGL